MRTQRKLSNTYFGLYLLAFTGFTILFVVVGFTMFHSFRDYAMNDIMREAGNTAKSYSYSIRNNMKARSAVNELIKHKILAAGNALVDARGIGTADLQEMAAELQVDSIDVYNPEGVVINSAYPGNVGWSVYEGHPVNEFYKSDEKSLVGGLRVNTISDKEFQYGYFRMENGGFIQVGVSAERIYSFSDDFELINSINEIKQDNSHLFLSFIDGSNRILASTESEKVGQTVIDPDAASIIESGIEKGLLTYKDDLEIYEVFVPIYQDGTKIGTLSVGESTVETKRLMQKLFYVGIAVMIFVYGIFLLLISTVYKRNRELIALAYFDDNTGLPNPAYLKALLLEKKRVTEEKKSAIILVNNSQNHLNHLSGGYEYDGKMIREMGNAIPKLTNLEIQIFSLSEDKFILHVEGYDSKQDLIDLIEKITTLSSHYFNVRGSIEYLNIRFGVTEITEENKSLEQLIKEASVSISTIDQNDHINYAFFSYHTGRKLQMEEIIEDELQNVIDDDTNTSFHLVFQPIVSLKDASIFSFEALSRFVSKKYGEVPPNKFIEIAERRNLVIPLGNLIFTKACRYAGKLLSKGYGHIRVSVNISDIQILHESFIHDVLNIMEKEGITGRNITLEISESVLIDNFDSVNRKLKELRSYGLQIALDNYGTHYFSLLRLKTLEVDILKIDKSFIDPIIPGDTSGYITRDVISLAHRIGLIVVSGGVESEAQLDYLFHSDCDYAQGYLISEPCEEQEANLLLITNPNKCWPYVYKRRVQLIPESLHFDELKNSDERVI